MCVDVGLYIDLERTETMDPALFFLSMPKGSVSLWIVKPVHINHLSSSSITPKPRRTVRMIASGKLTEAMTRFWIYPKPKNRPATGLVVHFSTISLNR